MFYVRRKPLVYTARIAEHVEYFPTPEGMMKADIGDYIMTGVKGERWPVKPDVFEQTYEII